MKSGDIISVISRGICEGKALLVSHKARSDYKEFECWEVRFQNVKGEFYEDSILRWIDPKHITED